MPEAPGKPGRRFLRFSLRAFLLFVLLFGVGLGWAIHEARKQGIAVRALAEVGCLVDCNPPLNRPATLLERLRQLIGEENPWNATEIHANIRPKTRQVADVDLVHLRALPHIRVLLLGKTQVTDVGLANVQGLNQLESLGLTDNAVTDAGLANCEGLRKLRALHIDGTGVTDSGLIHLRGLSKLFVLNLGGTAVTDVGLAHIEGLTGLEYLHLDRTPITDAGLVYLEGMIHLRYLDLGSTSITEAGLVHLKAPQLRDLNLYNTRVSNAVIRELRRALGPRCRILQ